MQKRQRLRVRRVVRRRRGSSDASAARSSTVTRRAARRVPTTTEVPGATVRAGSVCPVGGVTIAHRIEVRRGQHQDVIVLTTAILFAMSRGAGGGPEGAAPAMPGQMTSTDTANTRLAPRASQAALHRIALFLLKRFIAVGFRIRARSLTRSLA